MIESLLLILCWAALRSGAACTTMAGLIALFFTYQMKKFQKNEHTSQAYVQWPLACVPCSADEYKGIAMSADHGLLLTTESS